MWYLYYMMYICRIIFRNIFIFFDELNFYEFNFLSCNENGFDVIILVKI